MNMVDIIIVVIIVIAMFFAGKKAIKQFTGKETCCGGSGDTVVSEKKTLSGPILGKKVLKISGMHCEHCVANVTNALNTIEGASAQVDLSSEEAIVSYDRELNDDDLRKVVKEAGYKVVSINA